MNDSEKFLITFGSIFFSVGLLMTIIGLGILLLFHEWFGGGIPLILGLVFGSTGGGILFAQLKSVNKRKNVTRYGQQFTGKIYGYVEDKSATMNNDYLVNIKVHYFDQTGTEREAILPTKFTKGSGDYPIGATIDIVVLDNEYSWIKDSIRYERIAGEDILMDDKPMDPQKIDRIAVTCPNCGASFSAAKGYVNHCPYCNGALNC